MTLVLFALGMLITAAGVAMIGFGIPINEFSLGNTLIVAGTVAVVGGLLLVGLAAAVRQLGRLIEAQAKAARASRAAESFEGNPPRDMGPPRSGQSRQQYGQSQRLEHPSHDPRLNDPRFSPVPVDALEEQITERPRQAHPAPHRPDPHLAEAM